MMAFPLWLPPSLRESGSDIVEDGSISMRKGTKTWEGRTVLVARGGIGLGSLEVYYDPATGFLVGSYVEAMGSSQRTKLLSSNIPGL